MSGFQKATKRQSKARIAFDGPSGSGKTWTSLVTATALANGGKVAVIDSERGSASKYASDFDFDVLELDAPFHPDRYRDAIRQAVGAGYDALVIDSLTHAWAGVGGVLEIVDGAKSKFGGNSYMAWSVGTPLWQALIDAILSAPLHVVVTMRSKTKFVEDDSSGKKSYKRAGTEAVARDGVEYEFDVVGDLDLDHLMVVSKSRAGKRLQDMYRRPGPEFGEAVLAWLNDGAVDAKERARNLMQVAGDKDALVAALAAAGIKSADLADEAKWGEATTIANRIAAERAKPKPAAEATPPADPPAEPTGEVISEEQRRRMLAIGSKAGLSKDDVKDVVAQMTGVDSTTKVPLDRYEAVCTYIESLTPVGAATGGDPT